MVMAQFPVADCIRDIQDGRVYQKFIQHDPCARGKKVLLIVVTTAVHCWLSPKSLVSLATYLFSCGVTSQERYKFENILLTGLWYGKSKPHVPLFSKHYTNKLLNMANGSNCNNETCELVSSECRIQSDVPHLPAKALLLNIKQHNGKFGCSTCKHPGRYSHSDGQIHVRLYENWPSGTVAVRTAQETRMFGRIVEARGTTVFGIKGENVFCQLTDIPDNLPIDWMHCVCKGILKRHAAIQMVVQSSVCCRFKQFARN